MHSAFWGLYHAEGTELKRTPACTCCVGSVFRGDRPWANAKASTGSGLMRHCSWIWTGANLWVAGWRQPSQDFGGRSLVCRSQAASILKVSNRGCCARALARPGENISARPREGEGSARCTTQRLQAADPHMPKVLDFVSTAGECGFLLEQASICECTPHHKLY